jgi:hypothetical protein
MFSNYIFFGSAPSPVTTNALALADPAGHLKRHFLVSKGVLIAGAAFVVLKYTLTAPPPLKQAPRAATQDAMNLNFLGSEYELVSKGMLMC